MQVYIVPSDGQQRFAIPTSPLGSGKNLPITRKWELEVYARPVLTCRACALGCSCNTLDLKPILV